MGWRERFRDAVVAWLGIDGLQDRTERLIDETKQRHVASQEVAHLRAAQQMERDAAMAAKLDRVLELLEPQLKQARAAHRPISPDWDAVQEQNLQQFEENNHGKSVR